MTRARDVAAGCGYTSAVFSGAKLSGAGPASLPKGIWLRDGVVRTIFDAAEGSPTSGLLRTEHLDDIAVVHLLRGAFDAPPGTKKQIFDAISNDTEDSAAGLVIGETRGPGRGRLDH